MTRLVLDTSVCLKWFLHERGDEPDCEIALDLHARVRSGDIHIWQPVLWRAEIAAGLARMLPDRALGLVEQLGQIEATIIDNSGTLLRATQMAMDLNHHLFDTIYHAAAIEHGIDLVTADEHYYRKARGLGSIVLLRDWRWKPRGIAEPRTRYVEPRKRRKSGKS